MNSDQLFVMIAPILLFCMMFVLYIYLPYTYVVACATLALIIGFTVIHIYGGASVNWIMYILLCNFIATAYLHKEIQPSVTIWVVSLGIYASILYIQQNSKPTSRINTILQNIYIVLFIILVYIISVLTLLYYGIYTLWGILSVCILLYNYYIGYLSIVWVCVIVTLLIIVIFVVWKRNNNSNNVVTQDRSTYVIKNTPIEINPYKILLTQKQMDRIRPNKYRYNIQFSLWINPYTSSNTSYSMVTIDNNIDIKYNAITGILSVWIRKMGDDTTFTQLYGNYYAPLQTWIVCVINIIDGKLDMFIQSQLKLSSDIILNQQDTPNPLTIGDIQNSVMKGFIKNVKITNGEYIPEGGYL